MEGPYRINIPVVTSEWLVINEEAQYCLELFEDCAVFSSGMITGVETDRDTKVETEISFDHRFVMLKRFGTGCNLYWSWKMKRYVLEIHFTTNSCNDTGEINFMKKADGLAIQKQYLKWLLS